jgi:hypothetical protein
MALPQPEVEFLDSRRLVYTVHEEAGMTCVVFSNYRLPGGLSVGAADLLIRLSPGFPDVPPDMWWFSPGLSRTDGVVIPATDVTEQHLGRTWQRWSRHLNASQWQSGIDNLQTFLAMIDRELAKYAQAELIN